VQLLHLPKSLRETSWIIPSTSTHLMKMRDLCRKRSHTRYSIAYWQEEGEALLEN
jgi:hypothetical protein